MNAWESTNEREKAVWNAMKSIKKKFFFYTNKTLLILKRCLLIGLLKIDF